MTATTPTRRDYARRYAEARQFRRDMRQAEMLNTTFALAAYIRSLRKCWQFERRNP